MIRWSSSRSSSGSSTSTSTSSSSSGSASSRVLVVEWGPWRPWRPWRPRPLRDAAWSDHVATWTRWLFGRYGSGRYAALRHVDHLHGPEAQASYYSTVTIVLTIVTVGHR